MAPSENPQGIIGEIIKESIMKKIVQEFREFIMRGNVLDLAVGVIIGGAFGSVINGLVNDIIMPPIGMLLGRVNFSDLYLQLNRRTVPLQPHTPLAVAQEQGAVVIAYGNFLTAIISFLLIAFCIFLVIKAFKRITDETEKHKQRASEVSEEPTEKTCQYCQTSIPIKATRCPHCTSQLTE